MKKISSINEAVNLLQESKILACPTETYYALACSAFAHSALNRIYEIKERNISQPLPLIVRDFEQALEIADIDQAILPCIQEITEKFWPAPLSILLKAKTSISPIITANTGTIVVRQSPHSACLALTKALNAPIISTSANKSGEKAAQFAYELDENLHIDGILKYGESPQGGLPSTIIEVIVKKHENNTKKIRLLRKGAFDLEILKTLGYTLID